VASAYRRRWSILSGARSISGFGLTLVGAFPKPIGFNAGCLPLTVGAWRLSLGAFWQGAE